MGTVKIDSRNVCPGDTFVAINKGVNFVGDAIGRGAKECVVSLRQKELVDSKYLDSVKFVEDTILYLGEIARVKRSRFAGKVIGITGSAGKTTFKNIISFFLRKNGVSVSSSLGNYNNQIGLPLSILDADLSSDFWILEMGISMKGDMDYLLSIASPDIGFITSVYPSHLEGLGDVSVVCREKAKLVNSAKMGYVPVRFFYNLCDYISDNVKWASAFVDNSFPVRGEQFWDLLGLIRLFMEVEGRYSWIDWSAFKMPSGRFFVERFWDKIIVDDSYNANPGSMKSSLSSLRHLFDGKRLALILGDMLELGEREMDYHQDIVAFVKFLFPNETVILVGERFCKAAYLEDFSPAFKTDSWYGIENTIFSLILEDDVWFFKGSNGMMLSDLVCALKNLLQINQK